MPDKLSTYLLALGGDDADLRTLMTGVKSRFRSDVAELEAITKKVVLFGDISTSVDQVQRALDTAKQKVTQFSQELEKIKSTGAAAPKELTKALADAEAQVLKATKALASQQQQLATLDTQLSRAGVNTKQLAAEQIRLAEASKVAADAASVMAAKQALGLVTLKEITPEIAKQRAAFETLRASGTLSATEIAAAQKLLTANIKELNTSVSAAGGGFVNLAKDTKASFSDLILPITAGVAAVTSFAATLASVTGAAKEFRQALAEVEAGSNLSKEQIAALGHEAQQLAQELGVDVIDALHGVRSLLAAGVPEDNTIEVLRIAAEAAKASLSDLGTGVTIAKLLLRDFNVPVSGLGAAFDTLKASVGGSKQGFEAFAASAGPLLGVARASDIGLTDLAATLQVMTKNGIDADTAMADLTKIIVALGKPEARSALHGIGIDSTDLVTIFTKLGESGAKLQDVIDLTGVSKKSGTAIAALVNNSGELVAAFDKAANSAGIVSTTVAKMYDSPKEISERFHATLEVTKEKLGELVGASGRATVGVTALLGRFNDLIDNAARFTAVQNAQGVAIDRAALSLLGFGQAQTKATEEADAYAAKENAAAEATERHTVSLDNQVAALQTNAASLLKNAQALQGLVDLEIKAVEDGSTRQIAALDLLAGARRQNLLSLKDAAALTLVVQQATAEKEIAILNDKETKITDLAQKAIDARRKAAEGNPLALKKLADDELQIRTKSVGEQIALYQSLYDRIFAQAKAGQDRVNALDLERLSFTEGIEAKLRALKLEGLSDSERYQATIRQVEDLTSKARQARVEGDTALEKKYTDQAIATAEQIKEVVSVEGSVVISKFQAQQVAIGLIKTAADAYSKSLKDQGDAASEGANKAKEELAKITPTLDGLKQQLDQLHKDAADVITLNISEDIVGIDVARAALADLVKPETKVITVQYQTPGGAPAAAPSPAEPGGIPLAQGGPVWKQYAQALAAGGPVFRRPNWSKVPGSGSGDTVPALLQEGSFVVRKAASERAGDNVMARLARGYADGGSVDLKAEGEAIDILRYAKYLTPLMRGDFWKSALPSFNDQIDYVEKHPKVDYARNMLLKSAREIAGDFVLASMYGTNWSAAGAKNLPDFQEWLDLNPRKANTSPYKTWAERHMASGGPIGTDTVPAMLTPGEYVFSPPAVKALGGGFLDALNRGDWLAPPRMPHFATGGSVGAIPDAPVGGLRMGGGDTINIHLHGTPADFMSESNVRRFLAPAWNALQRRTGNTGN